MSPGGPTATAAPITAETHLQIHCHLAWAPSWSASSASPAQPRWRSAATQSAAQQGRRRAHRAFSVDAVIDAYETLLDKVAPATSQ